MWDISKAVLRGKFIALNYTLENKETLNSVMEAPTSEINEIENR